MREITSSKAVTMIGVARWSAVSALLVFAFACGEASIPAGPPFTGPGGSGGSFGTGGVLGTGGIVGSGGVMGTGGTAGSGGTGGTGVGGAGGALGPCATNALCHTCPDQFLCDTDDDCAFSGYVCVDSGCSTHEGAPIKQCQPSRGGSCIDDADCPNTTDYDCTAVGAGATRCVRVSPGCSPATESYDCVPGFSCEGGTCVDRRVPCVDYQDCPKSHVCSTTPTASFCVRVYRTCHEDEDCGGFGSLCADIDNDGTNECAGEIGPSDPCVNTDCTDLSAPVCEAGVTGTTAVCGDYGLCRVNDDCDTGFECVGLWQDGRKECVRINGSCDQVTDCPLRQVCAAPRDGGPPSCQRGIAP